MKKGTKVRVVNNSYYPYHGFEIGETVEFTGEGDLLSGNYKFKNKTISQWMDKQDYEPIKKPKTREQLEKKIAKYTKQLQGLEDKKEVESKSGWYKDTEYSEWIVYRDFENGLLYGFNTFGKWFHKRCSHHIDDTECLATEEEVFEALKAEAIRRGFKEGGWFKCLRGHNSDAVNSIDKWFFDIKTNKLWTMREGDGGRCAFDNGEWAEIISTPTLNGKEVKMDENNIMIGCKVFNKRKFESEVKYLDKYNITSITHPKLGEIKINDLKELIN